jgi:exo-1,4-beta-D-glucosaminidase
MLLEKTHLRKLQRVNDPGATTNIVAEVGDVWIHGVRHACYGISVMLQHPRPVALACLFAAHALGAAPTYLRQGWALQSSTDVRDGGEAISRPGYEARDWYKATVPTTVFGALVSARVFPDPYFGMNLREASGVTYPVGMNFSNVMMPPDSPFRHSWWFRKEFAAEAGWRGKTLRLGFDGINYRCNVWLNGRRIADAKQMAGAWRLFEFDVTDAVAAENALAIEVFPPQPGDLAITFVDWNPMPPDKDMGLWREVWLKASGPAALRFPTVTTHLVGGAAEVTVRAEVVHAGSGEWSGMLRGSLGRVEFSEPVRVTGSAPVVVRHQLRVERPRLWWPAQVGAQELYPLELRLEAGGQVSDTRRIEVGLREATSAVDAKGHRVFRVNGKTILIRGAGYTFDMLLRSSPERQDDELRYVRDLNLNAIRFEGKLEDERFLEQCDRLGILVLAGWCCCDAWEHWQDWGADNETVAVESLRDQLRRLARHPSVIDWMYGSDNPPPPKVEKLYLDTIAATEWPNSYHSSATAKPTPLGGATGVKMSGPYEYVAPSYWYVDETRGGAHGFNTETSPGPAPPPVESLRRMLPGDRLWPGNPAWDFHAGGGTFRDIHVFTEALNVRYGAPPSVEEFARKAQMMAYETHRAMFEAYGRNKYVSTGVIQWMLNTAWPGLIWHLYDWYLRPGGSYFGSKKANEPLHVQYSYDDRSVVIVNSYYRPESKLTVRARVLNLDASEKFARTATVDVGEDSATRVFAIPELQGLSRTYFVDLVLERAAGEVLSRNFYWLSTAPETLEWDQSTYYHTPTKTFADYKLLDTLPKVQLTVTYSTREAGEDRITTARVTNRGKSVAFGVRLKVNKGPQGEEVLPVLWQDNYLALLPGETREVTATYRSKDLGKASPAVEVEAWNGR